MALVVFLRGVNVGGHKTFRPTALASQLKHLDPVNIGAAGTFVIRRPVTRAQLRAELRRRLPFETEIMICQGRDVVRLIAQNPFDGQPEDSASDRGRYVLGQPLYTAYRRLIGATLCRRMRRTLNSLALVLVLSATLVAQAPAPAQVAVPELKPVAVTTAGTVGTSAGSVSYQATAGTMVVHPKGWDDAAPASDGATATMSYVAYVKADADAAKRPIMFLFNGGPGSATVWLHMGAFGPKRVVTVDTKAAPAPYSLVDNEHSLLDVSDLVFVDAPGTGFGRIAGKDKEQAFYGVDQDIHAFAVFIRDFLTTHNRWMSPKYVFGESYGTTRAAGLALALQDHHIDLNGLVLLSTILNWDTMPDDPQLNPSIDVPYVVSLPTYAATAWYHQRLPDRPTALRPFLDGVEQFATTEYAAALMEGYQLSPDRRQAIAEKLHRYTGLPVAYLVKTNLRIEYGAFQKELLADKNLTTGTLDTRFLGDTLDPLSKVASGDPTSSAISAPYVAAFNSYARETLRQPVDLPYRASIPVYDSWDYKHQAPGSSRSLIALPNMLPDLAAAMKNNPSMKVLVTGGYYDVSTPYFEGVYEFRHLPIPASLLKNIEYRYYESGHMVYVNLPILNALHDDVAAFVRGSGGGGK
jgi:carboxypeptidase C (cathepsin A)